MSVAASVYDLYLLPSRLPHYPHHHLSGDADIQFIWFVWGLGEGEGGGGRRGFSEDLFYTFVNVQLIGTLPTLTPPAEVKHFSVLDAALRPKGNNTSNCQQFFTQHCFSYCAN